MICAYKPIRMNTYMQASIYHHAHTHTQTHTHTHTVRLELESTLSYAPPPPHYHPPPPTTSMNNTDVIEVKLSCTAIRTCKSVSWQKCSTNLRTFMHAHRTCKCNLKAYTGIQAVFPSLQPFLIERKYFLHCNSFLVVNTGMHKCPARHGGLGEKERVCSF